MRKTPQVLQDAFGIEPEKGLRYRSVPRAYMSYSGPRKRQFLVTLYALIAAGALPAEHQSEPRRRKVTQADLADVWYGRRRRSEDGASGRRVTFTRRLRYFARPPKPWSSDVVELIGRQRRWGEPNVYSPGRDIAHGSQSAKGYLHPTHAELAAHPISGRFFHASGAGGYFKLPDYVTDPRLPLNATQRLVLSYYVSIGLLDGEGEISPHQSTVAAAVGCSVKSVYRSNKALEALKLIRVVQSTPIQLPDGRTIRGPAHILNLQLRQLTHEEAAAEAERLYRLQRTRQETAYWNQISDYVFGLLARSVGRDRSLSSIQGQCRHDLAAFGVPLHVLNVFFPRPPT